MSSQFVTIPCSIGYFNVKIPRFDWASSPTYESWRLIFVSFSLPQVKNSVLLKPWLLKTCHSFWKHTIHHSYCSTYLLTHTNHNTLVPRTSNNWWEHSTWGIVTSKSSFTHPWPIVDHECRNVVVTHFGNSLIGLPFARDKSTRYCDIMMKKIPSATLKGNSNNKTDYRLKPLSLSSWITQWADDDTQIHH